MTLQVAQICLVEIGFIPKPAPFRMSGKLAHDSDVVWTISEKNPAVHSSVLAFVNEYCPFELEVFASNGGCRAFGTASVLKNEGLRWLGL